jgi:hypothetical protein
MKCWIVQAMPVNHSQDFGGKGFVGRKFFLSVVKELGWCVR